MQRGAGNLIESEERPHTERLLMFDETEDTGTTNDVEKLDEGIMALVGNEGNGGRK